MTNDPLAQFIRLPDGRRLGYAEFGMSGGPVVFHFHGLPGSRLEGRLLAKAASDLGVHLIAVDRPGMGLSDFLENRKIGDWPVDIAALADSLGIEKFGVEGFSGGGPYAASCALTLHNRVTTCGLVSSAGPRGIELGAQNQPWPAPSNASIRKFKDSTARAWSGFARGCRDIASALHFVEEGLAHMFPGGPDPVLSRERRIQEIFAADFYEAFRQGVDGEIHEDYLRNTPWDFNLAHISPRVPVILFHGELDANVPICVGKSIARTIPHSDPTFFPIDGHISVPWCHSTEILLKITRNLTHEES